MAPVEADEAAANGPTAGPGGLVPDGHPRGRPTPSSTTSSDGGGGGGSDGSGGASSTAKGGGGGGDSSSSAPTDESPELEPVSLVGLFRFATRGDVALMVLGTVCALGHGTMLPLFTILFGDIIDAGGVGTQTGNAAALLEDMRDLAIKLLILSAVAAVLAYFQVFCWSLSATHQGARIRRLYLRSLFRQEMGWYDVQGGAGELTSRVASDVDLMTLGMGPKVAYFLQYFGSFVAGLAIAFAYGWSLTLVVLAVVPILVLCGAAYAKSMSSATLAGQAAYAKAGGVAEEVLGLIRTVVAFGCEEQEAVRYESHLRNAAAVAKRRALLTGAAMGLSFFVMLDSYALAFWVGNRLVRRGDMDAGSVMTVFFSVLIGAMGIGQGQPSIAALNAARGCAPRIFSIIDRDSEIDPLDTTAGEVLPAVAGDLALEGVDFTYPTRPEGLILRQLSLSVSRGQTLALVGASGCGKSTVVQLLERLYDPLAGSVRLDGVDVRSLNVQWLRSQIGYVSQLPTLFAMSIRENIRLGAGVTVVIDPSTGERTFSRQQVTDEDIVAAATTANAHAFISRLPDGYDTLLGARGAKISGGQKQRIAIARALVRRPAVLLLDEATSALDTASERAVQVGLRQAAQGRTTVVIAHRLSTICDADSIAVLGEEGRVLERGSHADLMELPDGTYRQLVQLQSVIQETQSQRDARHAAERQAVNGEGTEPPSYGTLVDEDGDDDVMAVAPAVADVSDDAEPEPDVDSGVFLRAVRANAREWPFILLGTLFAMGAGAAWPIFAVLLSKLLVLLTDPSQAADDRVNHFALGILGLAAGLAVCNFGQIFFLGVSGEALTLKLRAASFRKLLRCEMGFFDDPKHSVGALGVRLATESTHVRGLTGDASGTLLMTLGAVGVGIILGLVGCWPVALAVLALMPAAALNGFLEVTVMSGTDARSQAAFARAGQIASESVDNIRAVTTLGAQEFFLRKYKAELAKPVARGRRGAVWMGLGFGFSEACMYASFALAFWYGAKLTGDGVCNFEETLWASQAIFFGMIMIGQAAVTAPDLSGCLVAATNIFRLLDRKSAIDPLESTGARPAPVHGAVECDDVGFAYPSRPDVQVLRGLSTAVTAGRSLALVGESGCGKSTVVALLLRFYDPTTGAVRVDGLDLPEWQVAHLRSHLAVVAQEPDLRSMSVRENIAYGFPSGGGDGPPVVVTDAAVEAAARAANAHDFVMALPGGYDAFVGERGSHLSGGQRQRICLARALVRSPRVLLLDEATSALDSVAERAVQAALDEAVAAGSRTTVVIAHRLSTVVDADIIAVVAKGAVVEAGSHEELLAAGGAYTQLVQNQAMDS